MPKFLYLEIVAVCSYTVPGSWIRFPKEAGINLHNSECCNPLACRSSTGQNCNSKTGGREELRKENLNWSRTNSRQNQTCTMYTHPELKLSYLCCHLTTFFINLPSSTVVEHTYFFNFLYFV